MSSRLLWIFALLTAVAGLCLGACPADQSHYRGLLIGCTLGCGLTLLGLFAVCSATLADRARALAVARRSNPARHE